MFIKHCNINSFSNPNYLTIVLTVCLLLTVKSLFEKKKKLQTVVFTDVCNSQVYHNIIMYRSKSIFIKTSVVCSPINCPLPNKKSFRAIPFLKRL